ncbi:MAG: hypothetical protein KJ630_14385 [Proteobacteria bacterium]|nr:hypothetical protein [Pseudomonadota bacterium]
MQMDSAEKLKSEKSAILGDQGLSTGNKECMAVLKTADGLGLWVQKKREPKDMAERKSHILAAVSQNKTGIS